MRHLEIALLGLALAAVAAPPLLAETAEEIDAAKNAYVQAFNSGDPEAVAALYTSDAVYLAPGWQFMEGPGGVETLYTAFFNAGFENMSYEILSLTEIGGDAAIEVSIDSTQRTDADGNVTDFSYKVLTVWERSEDGNWLISRLSFNDLP